MDTDNVSRGPFLVGFLAAVLFLQLIWVLAYWRRRNDYADIAWGPGFVLVSWISLVWSHVAYGHSLLEPRALLVNTLVTAWGVRLMFHLGRRNLRKDEEDERYAKWRKEWGANWVWRSWLQVFVLQSLILFVIELPILFVIAAKSVPLRGWAFFGGGLWLLGFCFESFADAQLAAFKTNPSNKGKIIETGLWRWSRHPNYFGEVVQWWGLYFVAFEVAGGWLTILSPLTITFFILKVSGVPMLEKQMENRPGFAAYCQRTPKFFPWPW